ncbi:hypothetical protein [Flavobacterium hiemivividum]|uniref:Lipoprotein n=1 Tax=Flavobacterium hiemivividum TaxID=2541734 RepID=A0A4R5CTZ4_9FLAO|nr:hypothetical protein [Flavobacterium hiemivividum]TDE04132.1 hypothetical protein E0F98_09260 [Flavobacterium hiemivividum]
MNQYHSVKTIGLLLVTMLFFSCSSDLDFNQANDFKLEPVFIANLTSFDIPANQFIENGVEQNISVEAQEFDVFRDSFFRKNLRRADFLFEINNTINRSYTFDIFFLDRNDQALFNIHFDVPVYTGTKNEVTRKVEFKNANLDLLKSTRRMSFVLTMKAGPVLDTSSPGSLKFTSSATAYFLIE